MTHEHHHHDSHEHQHDATAAFTEKNRQHWDTMASSYDSEQWQKNMLNALHAFLLENIQWIGAAFIDPSSSFEHSSSQSDNPIRVLDYACGPGTVTNILYSHANDFVGVDLSQAMVDAYNKRFSHMLPREVAQTNARAVVGNLIDPASVNRVAEAEAGSFDLVAVGLGFHHFADVKVATERLTSYLKPGGVFLIVDFLPHSKESSGQHVHPGKHTVAHHGFGEKEVRELFGGAGLKDVRLKVMEEQVLLRGTDERTVFMARGVRY